MIDPVTVGGGATMIDAQPLSILVVEPHAKFGTLVSRRLEADGDQTTHVADGHSALEMLRSCAWQMVWLHPALGDASWKELAQAAREQAPDCFITLLSDVAVGPERGAGPWADVILPRAWKDAELREALAGAASRV